MTPTLLEAFELGKDLESFIHSSHCFDARDMGRFWILCDHPQWVRELGKVYDEQCRWTGTKEQGVMAAHKIIRDFLGTLPPSAARSVASIGVEK